MKIRRGSDGEGRLRSLDLGVSTEGDFWCIDQLACLNRVKYMRIIGFFQKLDRKNTREVRSYKSKTLDVQNGYVKDA